MVHAIRAIYQNGQLRLLDPVDLVEGQEIQMMILPDKEQIRSALGDLLVDMRQIPDEELDEDALLHEIEAGFRNLPPVSESIIDERREGS